ncbi:MAPK-activated protein kinase Srk1 [Aspergillus melleus]|uniref:MAPK-activated protein kinase Srk1 n=1 Tax=Aspergillus melleus TaxID=138277 RepID=UPI001E8EDAAF|nr:MAPK-activated protein kinase Srk1 [Aspergillus melleus]KAH8423183.1 MAPK-activated protein kinase Srk1 [Aspergillus melleus]
MSTIQNLKNFIRHGKQARLVTPHAEPTTNVSPIHAEQQRQPQRSYPPAAGNLDAIDSKLGQAQPQPAQKSPEQPQSRRARDAEIEQIVAEEKSVRSKMPRYPGLERWILLEKMGDGAFSNVYRAKDTTGEYDEVAIKVVRKFEMNSNQVGSSHPSGPSGPSALPPSSFHVFPLLFPVRFVAGSAFMFSWSLSWLCFVCFELCRQCNF